MNDPARGVTLFPAIDLRGGRCVRLEQGAAERETRYDTDPLKVARRFVEAGAEWLHVVDLDAAFGEGSNRALIAEIARSLPVRVQTGGGLRSEAEVDAVLEAGARRAVIGTAATRDPGMAGRSVERWGADRIAVGLDARGRRVAVRGWREESGAELFDLGARLAALGVRTLVYTDIERDGMLSGPNLEVSSALAEHTGAEVIVSGGVSGPGDLEAVAAAEDGIRGVIVGKALYEGRLDVARALRILESGAVPNR